MRPRAISTIAVVLAAILILTIKGWAQNAPAIAAGNLQAPIGKLVSATGTVTIEHAVAVVVQANLPSGATQAKVGDFVYQGDVVQTGAGGKAGITFTDGTSFNISSNARMVLDEFVYDPKGRANSTLFTLTKGTFSFVAGNVATTGNMRVDTRVGTMGIRGTTPHIKIDDDGSVSFSTLIEGKKDSTTAPSNNDPQIRRAAPSGQQQGGSAAPRGLTRQQSESYDRLLKLDLNICRAC